MKMLRAFQIVNRDGSFAVSSTYNEIDEHGEIIRVNAKDSFYAVDAGLVAHIEAIEQYIRDNRYTE